ncbi:MAG TPA: hypothetical protein VNX29_19950 [Kaistia sp.]|nr:hypothetical protein [Kaistia sp.]
MTTETLFPKRAWIPAEQSFASQGERLAEMVDRLSAALAQAHIPARPSRLSVIGIGASHAAAAAPVYAARADGIDAVRALPSELPANEIGHDGLAILVSQSGRSAEIVNLANNIDARRTFAITNYDPSPLGQVCASGLNLGNVPDSSVSFVSFTGTLLALGLLNDHWAGRGDAGRWSDAISDGLAAVAAQDDQLRAIAAMLAGCPSVDFVAPAPILSVAEEAALMFREGPRMMATAMETRQYLHGPMDAAGRAGHVVFGTAREALLINQLAEQTKNLVYVTGTGQATPTTALSSVIMLPIAVDDGIRFSIVASFVAQRLTVLVSELRGIDINEPVFVRLDTKTDSAGPAR